MATNKQPRYAALAAVALYAALVAVIRGAAGDVPLGAGIDGLDRLLYSRALDAQAYVQGHLAAGWAVAFASTVATECFVLGLMLRGQDFLKVAWAGFLASLSTHPLLWFGLAGIRSDYAFWVLALELAIAGVEALVLHAVLREVTLRRCVRLSVVANGASFLLGLLGGVG
ncbi:MAG TPA: hypothetical protein VFF03_01245 [Rhodocyclaceae bacterium]|nr:hypothetical protein [Rhodocyclaceae bacterium]